MTKQLTAFMFMGLFLCGCKDINTKAHHSNELDKVKLEDIASRFDEAEGWSDIFLKITEDNVTDTSHVYIAKGLYKNKIVGLQIEISSNIGPGIINGMIDNESGFLTNAVRFKSIGIESDELIKAIAELYKLETDKEFTKKIISATVFSLNEKPVNLNENDYYLMKLFFVENDENLYAELYLNINTDKKEIEIHEKDEFYREPIIKVWTK